MARQRGQAFEGELNLAWGYYLDWQYTRIEDPAGGIGAKRASDYLALLPNGVALLAEAKSTQQPSLPKRNIKDHQLEALQMAERLGHKAYILINFRHWPKVNRAFAVSITDALTMLEDMDRKSIPLEWCEENAILLPRVDLWVPGEDGELKKHKSWDLMPLVDACLGRRVVASL